MLQRTGNSTISCPSCGRSWSIMEGLKQGDECPSDDCPSKPRPSVEETIKAMSDSDVDSMIEGAVDAALNAGCLHIQERINQTDGGIAGMVFGNESSLRNALRSELRDYFETERTMNQED